MGDIACSIVGASRKRDNNDSLPFATVFLAEIPKDRDMDVPVSAMRQAEIDAVENPGVKRQKYWSWRLLDAALRRAFGKDSDGMGVYRSQYGGLSADGVFISLSHTDSACAVALSSEAVGVDIERTDRRGVAKLADRYLTGGELGVWKRERPEDGERAFLRIWCAKEAAFKSEYSDAFAPSKLDSTLYPVRICEIKIGEVPHIVALCSELHGSSGICEIDLLSE